MTHSCRLREAETPRLRRYALALTRDVSGADDLVQSCLTRAIAKQHLWQAGTDLRAWLFTVLHNQHVSDLRRWRHDRNTVSSGDITPVGCSIEPNPLRGLDLGYVEA